MRALNLGRDSKTGVDLFGYSITTSSSFSQHPARVHPTSPLEEPSFWNPGFMVP